MRSRFPLSIPTYNKTGKNIDVLINAIQLELNEHVIYDPNRMSRHPKIILNSPYVIWSHKLLLLEKLVKLGVALPRISNIIPCVEDKIYNHNFEALESVGNLGLFIHDSNYLCLMTDDRHLPYILLIEDYIPFDKNKIKDFINIAIRCESWKILDYLIGRITYKNFNGTKTRARDFQKWVYPLVKKGEDKFLEIAPKLVAAGLSVEETEDEVRNLCIRKKYIGVLQFITENSKVNENQVKLYRYSGIIKKRDINFLKCFTLRQSITYINTTITNEWPQGYILLFSKIMSDPPDHFEYLSLRWLKSSYRPKNPIKMQIFHFTAKKLPESYKKFIEGLTS